MKKFIITLALVLLVSTNFAATVLSDRALFVKKVILVLTAIHILIFSLTRLQKISGWLLRVMAAKAELSKEQLPL